MRLRLRRRGKVFVKRLRRRLRYQESSTRSSLRRSGTGETLALVVSAVAALALKTLLYDVIWKGL